MADVSISQLTPGVPSSSSSIPFSDGGITKQVAPGNILANAGNVGIGTSNPVTKLTVNGDSFLNYTNSSGLLIRNLSSENRIDSYNYPITEGYPLALLGSTVRFQNASAETMRINSSGNVGIGTTTPATKLDVNGTIKATGLQVPGCVIQVVQAYKKDNWGLSSLNNWVDVTGLSVSINLKNSNSKILVSGTINLSRDCDGNDVFIRLLRNDVLSNGNSTGGTIGHAAAQISRLQANPVTFSYLDSITQTANTYKIQAYLANSACTMFVNTRGINDGGAFTLTSNLTLMEIAQ
jgi:hypothetical protein